jgi:hypothetical protein
MSILRKHNCISLRLYDNSMKTSPCYRSVQKQDMKSFMCIKSCIVLSRLSGLGVVTELLFKHHFCASFLTWLLIVSIPVRMCKISIGVIIRSFIIIRITLFLKTWPFWAYIPREGLHILLLIVKEKNVYLLPPCRRNGGEEV